MAEPRKSLSEMTDVELDVVQFERRAAFQRALSELVRRDWLKAKAVQASLESDVEAIFKYAARNAEYVPDVRPGLWRCTRCNTRHITSREDHDRLAPHGD